MVLATLTLAKYSLIDSNRIYRVWRNIYKLWRLFSCEMYLQFVWGRCQQTYKVIIIPDIDIYCQT